MKISNLNVSSLAAKKLALSSQKKGPYINEAKNSRSFNGNLLSSDVYARREKKITPGGNSSHVFFPEFPMDRP